MRINRLTARAVSSLSKPGRHADGGNLYLKIDRSGAKRWTFMFMRDGKQREAGLGSVHAISLAKAREIAAIMREQVALGSDPIDARRAEKSAEKGHRTFGDVADAYIEAHGSGWRNAKHRAQWQSTLELYCKPMWNKPVDEVTTEDVLAVLQPLWLGKAETASRLRGRIEAVLDAARVQGHRTGENPARWRGHLDHLLPKRKKLSRGHHAAMAFKDVPAFMAKLRYREGVAALALEFCILTAARSGEVRGMSWPEVDLEAKIWTVPAERMKGSREHRVPLVDRATEILALVRPLARGALVFPGLRDRPLSDMTLAAVLKRMGVDVTVHGFRSSFRDWAGDETTFPREVAEAALAHVAGDETERAYRRSDALEKRRKLMRAWADFLKGKSASKAVLIRLENGS